MSKFTLIYMNNKYSILVKDKEELKKELIKYAHTIGKTRNQLYFLQNGKTLSLENCQYKFIDKKKYIIFVYVLENKTRKIEDIENIICPECGNLASISANNDNRLTIENCHKKHKISNLTIDTFFYLQTNFSNNEEKCKMCNNKKSYYNNFYICYCNDFICPLCKTEHY